MTTIDETGLLVEVIEACQAAAVDFERFPSVLLAEVRRLVPCSIAVYNDVDPISLRNLAAADPVDSVPAWAAAVWERHAAQNPLFLRALEGDLGPYTLSDYLTLDELYALPLYQELYARLGVCFQMAFALATPHPHVVAITLSRGDEDFTPAERRRIRRVLPHLSLAYEEARASAGLLRERGQLAAAVDAAGIALLVLDDLGRVREISAPARELLATAGVEVILGRLAPAALIAARETGTIDGGRGRRLDVRVAPGADDAAVLVFERPPPELEGHGLTAREAEVILLASDGLAPKAIALSLGVSPRTVHKHLQNAYAKLGVANLVGALARLRR